MARKILLRIFLVFFIGSSLPGTAATFTSAAVGNYGVSGTWTFVGFDANGIPDQDDDIIVNHTVTLNASYHARNITINPAGNLNTSTFTMINWGNLTNNGTISGIGSWQFRATGTYSGNPLNSHGITYFYVNYTIAAGVNVVKSTGGIVISAGATVTNNGTFTLNNLNDGRIQFLASSSRWINAANSTLAVSANFIGTGTFDGSATGNLLLYKGSNANLIRTTNFSYYNLRLAGSTAHTKTLEGSISVANIFQIQPNVTVNFANFSMFLGGNWINSANTTCINQNQIIFVGSGTQTITRATGTTETFGSFIVAGSGTVRLNDSIFVNGSLTISSGTLDVNASNYSIRVRVNFNDNATFMARQGTVFMAGTVAQSIGGVSNTVFYNLHSTNSNGVTVSSFPKSISNILTVAAGPFGTSGGGSLTLLASSPTTAARIAPLGATASLTGTDWIIQTYIDGPATAYWQYLGSPVASSTINDWDSDTRFYMSAVGGNDGTACCPTFFSVRTYSQATNTYSNVTSTGTLLAPGRGFMVWMSDNMTGLTSPLIFDTRGTPNFNTVNRAVGAGGAGAGYNLVSNPMPSPVNYSTVVSASSATLSPNFLVLQENGSYATNPNGGTIATAQGFMCIASTAGNITFNESCKSTTANPNVIRMLAGNEFRIKVGNEVNGLGEETVVKLSPGCDESMNLAVDLPYLVSPYDNATHVYTQNSLGEQFIYNSLGVDQDHLSIPVNVVTSTPGVQTMTFKDLNSITEYNCAWLEDLTTGTRINLNTTDTYQFEEPEMGVTRSFILHFERTNDCNFDLQNTVASLDASTNVFVSGEHIFAQFEFETEEVVTISMFDLSGRMVMGETTMNVGQQTITLDNPDAHGIYLVRIQKGNEVSTKKIYY